MAKLIAIMSKTLHMHLQYQNNSIDPSSKKRPKNLTNTYEEMKCVHTCICQQNNRYKEKVSG